MGKLKESWYGYKIQKEKKTEWQKRYSPDELFDAIKNMNEAFAHIKNQPSGAKCPREGWQVSVAEESN